MSKEPFIKSDAHFSTAEHLNLENLHCGNSDYINSWEPEESIFSIIPTNEELVKMKYIQLMNYESGFKGYRVKIRRDGKTYQQYFSINDYSSWVAAKRGAVKWRDEFLDEWNKYCNGKDDIIQYQGTNTGFPGISVTYRKDTDVVEMKANIFGNGDPTGKSITLDATIGSKKYWKQYRQAFEDLKELIDDYNRRRFGGRWSLYKKRKGIM